MNWTRINNDGNGNPRHVIHFLTLLNADERETYHKEGGFIGSYNHAIKRARSIGGGKFHNKHYGGGIVFQSYNLDKTERDIIQAKEDRKP